MKKIKYNICNHVNRIYVDPVTGEVTEKVEEVLFPSKMDWSEANEEIAKREAYNGEYTIEDDGQPEPAPSEGDSAVWDELDAAYQEGVDSV